MEKNKQKKLSGMEKKWLNIMNLVKNDFIINKDGASLKKQEEILSDLTKEKPYEINALWEILVMIIWFTRLKIKIFRKILVII